MTDRVNISDLRLDSSIWPRNALDEEAIERYRDCLNELPPIRVDRKTMSVLDGRHRVEAHRREDKETIPVDYEDCPPHLFLARAYALNARHGLPVSNTRRDEIILSLHEKGMTQQQIATEMGCAIGTVNRVLSQFSTAENWDTKQGIRDYLSGMSLREVAEKHHVGKSTIERVLREYHHRKDLISDHCRTRGHLKSVVQYSDRGPWGDAKFPGNTSGYLLVDLIDYYQPKSILDPMEGSGTTGDVAFDMGDIRYTGLDLLSGSDLVSEEPEGEYDLIFWHPPYHDAVDYDIPHPNNLSRCPSLSDYLGKMKSCMAKLLAHLSREGHLCILCSDPRKDGSIQPIHSAIIGFNLAILGAALIKSIEGRSRYFDYGNAPFIPIVHEYVLIFSNKRV